MLHVTYGLFDDEQHARTACDAIEAIASSASHPLRVSMHQGRLDEGRLHIAETAAAEVVREGAAISGVAGAVIGGFVAGPAGIVPGGVLGALYGGVGGALAGASGPDRTLESLSKHLGEGKVLLVVEAQSIASRDAADSAMRANGGRVDHKPFL